MRLKRACVLLAFVSVGAFASADLSAAQEWQLVFVDEFESGTTLNPADWNFAVGAGGWGNNELQYYTDRPANARVENGVLILEALKENFGSSQYTSARVNTKGKHDLTYGRVEVRAKLPFGRGTWAAIWLLYSDNRYGNGSWPDNGEFDIMEHVGFDQGRVHSTIHVDKYNGLLGTQIGTSVVPSPDASTAFHEYAVEWTPNQMRAYVDGVNYFTYERELGSADWRTWPFDQPFHLILNVAIGGDWGGLQGIDDSIFPQRMEIDYVRIYQEMDPEPTVQLGGLVDNASFLAGDTLSATAVASDDQGSVALVQFMQGEGILAERSSPPYSLSVADLAEGCYSVSVRAFDDAGWIGQTEPVDVSVGANCGQAPYLMRPAPIPGVVEAEYFDLGGQGVGYSDLDQANTGTGIRSDEGVDIEGISGAGGAYGVINIGSRDWMEYTIEVAEPGLYSAKVRVASDNGGSFEILVDGVSKTGTVDILPTGGPDVYLNAILNFALDAGVHVLRYRGRAPGVNVDKIEFTYLGPTSTTEGKGAARFHVDEAFPNPTATEASFAVRLSQPGQLDVTVYDIRGRLVARPFSGRAATGERDVSIDVSHLRPGVYLVRVAVDDEVAVRRIVVAAH